MDLVAVIAAGGAYFVLGGLWFTPLFGRQWDRAVGFDRPPRWRPAAAYYLVPLAGCIVAATASLALHEWIQPETPTAALRLGLVIGIGFGATITSVNAVSPNTPRPGLYAAVTGSYHAAGLVLCSVIIHALR